VSDRAASLSRVLSILAALISVFVIATVAAKVRGLDITCGCFGICLAFNEAAVRDHWQGCARHTTRTLSKLVRITL